MKLVENIITNRKGITMLTEFKNIPVDTVFYLHHKEGLRGIKQSTRTARFFEPNRVFYVGQKERVHIKGKK